MGYTWQITFIYLLGHNEEITDNGSNSQKRKSHGMKELDDTGKNNLQPKKKLQAYCAIKWTECFCVSQLR